MPWKTTNLIVEGCDGRNWTLKEPSIYWTNVRGFLVKLELPVGTTSDGASIPEACWAIPGFQPFGLHWKAAFLHDALYHGVFGDHWSRLDCDDIFLEAMVNAGVDTVHREAIYHAVRKFGQAAFEQGRKSA
jgi:hypothetical protein